MSLPSPHPGHTCIVTGASSGIGREIARLLAGRGLGVTLVARRKDRLASLADELTAQHQIRAEVLAADLTDETSRDGLASELATRGLTVDMLVNNAGFSTVGAVDQSDPAREIAMIRTNVEAVVHLCSLFVPAMVAAGSGAVLNVASTAAFQPIPGQAGYAASKSFVLSYSQALRTEVRHRGVSVTVLCPGPVDTEFGEAAGLSAEEVAEAPLPKIMWVPATQVAAAALKGLEKGRAVVIPGAANRISASAAYLTPRRLLLPILAKQHPGLA